jgi:predicted aspartyl protease
MRALVLVALLATSAHANPIGASAHAAAQATVEDSVSITSDGSNHWNLLVGIGGEKFLMMLDTGAAFLAVTDSVADGLVTRGQASLWTAKGKVAMTRLTMADGHTAVFRRLTIHSVTIGSHVVYNIPAVAANKAMMLLPGSVLARIGKFTIDAANSKLSFGGARPVAAAPAPLKHVPDFAEPDIGGGTAPASQADRDHLSPADYQTLNQWGVPR